MDSQHYSITTLIPQRPPFVMVDCVLSCEDADAVTQLTVRQDNILLDGEFLSASGIIEPVKGVRYATHRIDAPRVFTRRGRRFFFVRPDFDSRSGRARVPANFRRRL